MNEVDAKMKSMKDNPWQWLKPYIAIARWVGWLMIFFGALGLFETIWGSISMRHETNQPWTTVIVPHALESTWQLLHNMFLPGILALGVAQFLRWLTDREARPGLLLRKGPRLLFFGAAIYFIQVGLLLWRIPGVLAKLDKPEYNLNPVLITADVIIPNLLIQVAPVIILFGLAEALRRLGPIVDESKDLI